MKRVNLLPQELRPKFEVSPDRAVQSAVITLVAYVALTTMYYPVAAYAQRRELAKLETADAEITLKTGPLAERLRNEESRGRRLAFVQSLLERKNRWSETFKEFSHHLPVGVWFTGLTSVTTEGARRFTLKGEALSQGKMAEFVTELERSNLFGGTTVDYSEREPNVEPEIFRFELSVPAPDAPPGATQ